MLSEFKRFISRGNVLDLAVGVIIGAAFGKIVTSLVNDVIMPPIGLVLGRVDFKDLFIDLSGKGHQSLVAAKAASAPLIMYGSFLNAIFEFLIIAFVVFLLIRQVNRLLPPAEVPPSTRPCPECLSEIPVAAKRCAHCTSVIPDQPVPPAP